MRTCTCSTGRQSALTESSHIKLTALTYQCEHKTRTGLRIIVLIASACSDACVPACALSVTWPTNLDQESWLADHELPAVVAADQHAACLHLCCSQEPADGQPVASAEPAVLHHAKLMKKPLIQKHLIIHAC